MSKIRALSLEIFCDKESYLRGILNFAPQKLHLTFIFGRWYCVVHHLCIVVIDRESSLSSKRVESRVDLEILE